MARCKIGDICEVIGGALGLQNLGCVVEVVRYEGVHSKYGIIWHCKSSTQDLITEYGAVGDQCDFADDWLRPIPPEQRPAVREELAEVKRLLEIEGLQSFLGEVPWAA